MLMQAATGYTSTAVTMAPLKSSGPEPDEQDWEDDDYGDFAGAESPPSALQAKPPGTNIVT